MDFAILKVNGRDVSNVPHEDMVRAFELAEEPIIIEVARRGATATAEAQPAAVRATAAAAAAVDLSVPSPSTLLAASVGTQPGDACRQLASALAADVSDLTAGVAPRMTSVATQTDRSDVSVVTTAAATSVVVDALSLPERRPAILSPPSPPPLTAFDWPQMLPPKFIASADTAGSLQLKGNHHDSTAIVTDVDVGCDAGAHHSVAGDILDQEDSTDELIYLSITLRRQQASDRVGLTLCYGPADPCSGVTDVFIGEVEPEGIAGQDGRIIEGDQLLQINGQDVLGRESAVRLFSECTKTISLLVCRTQSQWAEDDGFAEDPAEAIADYQELASRAARLAAAANKTVDICQGSGPRDVASQQPGAAASSLNASNPSAGRPSRDHLPSNTGGCLDFLGGSEAYLSTCGEEEEDDDDGATTVRDHEIEISEEHCRRFLQALQLKCETLGAQLDAESSSTSSPSSAAVAGCSTLCCPQQQQQLTPLATGGRPLQPRLGTGAPAAQQQQQQQQQQNSLTCDKRLSRRPGPAAAAEDGNSSSHDTAYNTAESCRSGSFAAHDVAVAAVPSAATAVVYRSSSSGTSGGCGGSSASPRLRVADRCRALRSPPTHDEARTRADCSSGSGGFAVASDRCTTVGSASAGSSRPPCRLPASRNGTGGCDASGIEYTDRNNLAQVMAMQQQRLLAERLAALASADSLADSHRKQQRRTATRGSGKSSSARAMTSAAGDCQSSNSTATAAASGSAADGRSGNGGPSMEWVVKVRADGSRYIARRPASRSRLLRERQRHLEDERCGLTTDDDAMSELKLGRRWSHAERRRHLESAREHRRRRELARLARATTAATAAATDGDPAASAAAAQAVSPGDLLLELSHRKLLRRQLADIDFTTVQELLVHGSRRHGVAAGLAGKALLSVTTV